MFFNRFWPNTNWSPKRFSFDLNLELQGSLKVGGSETNFVIQKLFKSKNPCGFVIPTLKVSVTNPQGFFDLSNFYITKLISEPPTLRPPCSSRLRSNEKRLVDQAECIYHDQIGDLMLRRPDGRPDRSWMTRLLMGDQITPGDQIGDQISTVIVPFGQISDGVKNKNWSRQPNILVTT